MKKYVNKHLAFHKSNELNCLISNVNWNSEKFRIKSYLENLINESNLNDEFYIYNSFDGYHDKTIIEEPYSGYTEVVSSSYGHESISISQRKKRTGIHELITYKRYSERKIHWDHGINFQIVNSAYGNTVFIISRPKCDDSYITHPEILLGYSKNTAYLTNKKLDDLFKTILFYERMTCFHRKKSMGNILRFKYLKLKSAILRKEISNTDSFSIFNITMLIIAMLTLICAYLAIPITTVS